MVLSLKTWESRSLPGLPRTDSPLRDVHFANGRSSERPFSFVGRETAPARGEPEDGTLWVCGVDGTEIRALTNAGLETRRQLIRQLNRDSLIAG